MSSIAANLQAVRQRIESATRAAGRPAQSVRLLAVSKTFPPAAVREAASAGVRDFGENYVQEGIEKIRELSSLGLTWHYIGPIQSNKTRAIAEHFDWVHSVDREKIAARLAQAPFSKNPMARKSRVAPITRSNNASLTSAGPMGPCCINS